MRIIKITSQHRRDFYADMVCEHCGHIDRDVDGYDDAHFHKNVIPKMQCIKCGLCAPDTYEPRRTKYDESATI